MTYINYTPTVNRQKKYMSAIFDVGIDGVTTTVTPRTNSVLPKGAIIIDHVIENITTMSSTGTPTLKIKLGSDDVTTSATVYTTYNGLNNVVMPTTTVRKITDAQNISLLFSSAVTGGALVITIGYFEAGDHIGLIIRKPLS